MCLYDISALGTQREREIRKKEKIYNEKRQKVKKGKREKERQTEKGKRLKC